jgi:hypothetical protein
MQPNKSESGLLLYESSGRYIDAVVDRRQRREIVINPVFRKTEELGEEADRTADD